MKATTKARNERAQAVSEACIDEHKRFNAALDTHEVFINTFAGLDKVDYVSNFDVHCTYGHGFTRTWMIANDGRWADLLKQAGVERNPLFR